MTCGGELVMRQRPKGKAVEIYALLPEEVQAMAQQNLMRMGAVENLEGMIADYIDPEI